MPRRGLEEDYAFTSTWLKACQRVLKPSGSIWVSGTRLVIFSVGFAMQRLGYKLLNTATWYKPNASPNLACRYFTQSTELLIWASPGSKGKLKHTCESSSSIKDASASPGAKVSGTVLFSVCEPERCLIEKAQVAAAIP